MLRWLLLKNNEEIKVYVSVEEIEVLVYFGMKEYSIFIVEEGIDVWVEWFVYYIK